MEIESRFLGRAANTLNLCVIFAAQFFCFSFFVFLIQNTGSTGWSQNSDHPASVARVLGLQTCAITWESHFLSLLTESLSLSYGNALAYILNSLNAFYSFEIDTSYVAQAGLDFLMFSRTRIEKYANIADSKFLRKTISC